MLRPFARGLNSQVYRRGNILETSISNAWKGRSPIESKWSSRIVSKTEPFANWLYFFFDNYLSLLLKFSFLTSHTWGVNKQKSSFTSA